VLKFPNFRCHGNSGLTEANFSDNCHWSYLDLAWPWKRPDCCKNPNSISYVSRVIAVFVTKFITEPTRVSWK